MEYPDPWIASREDLRKLYEARKSRRQAAIDKVAVASKTWREAMRGPEFPQTFHKFDQLPTEIKVQIIRIAIKEAIGEKCTSQMNLFARRYLAAVKDGVKDYLIRGIEIMKRCDLLKADCLGGLLGACRLLRNETIAWIEERKTKGEAWESERGVRAGKEQLGRSHGAVRQPSGIRKDARRWMAAIYRFQRMYDVGWTRSDGYRWTRPSDKKGVRVEIVECI